MNTPSPSPPTSTRSNLHPTTRESERPSSTYVSCADYINRFSKSMTQVIDAFGFDQESRIDVFFQSRDMCSEKLYPLLKSVESHAGFTWISKFGGLYVQRRLTQAWPIQTTRGKLLVECLEAQKMRFDGAAAYLKYFELRMCPEMFTSITPDELSRRRRDEFQRCIDDMLETSEGVRVVTV